MSKQKFKVGQEVWWPRRNFGVLKCKVIAVYEMGRQDRTTYEVEYFDDFLNEVCVGSTVQHFLYPTEKKAQKAWEKSCENDH